MHLNYNSQVDKSKKHAKNSSHIFFTSSYALQESFSSLPLVGQGAHRLAPNAISCSLFVAQHSCNLRLLVLTGLVRPAGIVLLATARRSGCSPTRTRRHLVLVIPRTASLQPPVAGSHWLKYALQESVSSLSLVGQGAHRLAPNAISCSLFVAQHSCNLRLLVLTGLVRPAGIEPATLTLRVSCSAD